MHFVQCFLIVNIYPESVTTTLRTASKPLPSPFFWSPSSAASFRREQCRQVTNSSNLWPSQPNIGSSQNTPFPASLCCIVNFVNNIKDARDSTVRHDLVTYTINIARNFSFQLLAVTFVCQLNQLLLDK